MRNINPATWKPTTEMIEAAKTLFLTMAKVQTIRPIVEAYKKRALAEIGFPGHELNKTYLLPEESRQRYYELLCVYRDEYGLKVDDKEKCPLLVAEHEQLKAEWALFDAMLPVTGISHDRVMSSKNAQENREKYIELTLRLLAPYVK